MAANPGTSHRTVVGLFEEMGSAERAAEELERAGFPRESLGIIAGHELSHPERHVDVAENSEGKVIHAVEKGVMVGGGVGALAGASVLLIPGLGPLLVGGALVTAFVAAGLGAAVGGVMAGLMKAGVNESDARLFEAGLRHGGVVLTLHTDEQHAGEAVRIMDANGAVDMDEHKEVLGDPGLNRVPGATENRIADTNRERPHPETSKENFAERMEHVALDENARHLDPWMKHAAILGGNAHPDDFEDAYRHDYENRYAGTEVAYAAYQRAYVTGAAYGRDPRYHGRDWTTAEAEIRKDWEARGHGPWDRFHGAIRHAFELVRGRR